MANYKDEEQLKIYEIWQRYKNEEPFQKEIENNYLNNPTRLNLFEFYVLEELVRFGNKNYYNDIMKTRQSNDQNIYLEYEMLINMCNSNPQFLKEEVNKLQEKSLFLSEMEVYVLKTFYKKEIDDNFRSGLKYDEFVKLRYGLDSEIRSTISNILVGNIVYELFNDEEQLKKDKKLEKIKLRQKEPGMIADIDKPYIIEKVKLSIFDDYDKFEERVDSMFTFIKYGLSTGKKENAFSPFIKQRTNIRNEDVGLEPKYDFSDFFGIFDDIEDPFGLFKKKK